MAILVEMMIVGVVERGDEIMNEDAAGVLEKAITDSKMKHRFLSLGDLPLLQERISGLHREGMLEIRYMDGPFPPHEFPEACSIIVMARTQMASRLLFTRGGRQVEVIIPPGYRNFRVTIKKVGEYLNEILSPHGFRVLSANRLPLKTLAAASGLGQYGRNNIIYVEGMGSYHQLLAYYTDLDISPEPLKTPELFADCETCYVCREKCPTNAVVSDRFPVYARRCLTYYSQLPPPVEAGACKSSS